MSSAEQFVRHTKLCTDRAISQAYADMTVGLLTGTRVRDASLRPSRAA